MDLKNKQDNLNQMYEKLSQYQELEHGRNIQKLKIGIWLLWIIPIVFLLLLFITNSNKIIFLVLWIVSLFTIAIYLILVEYRDYSLQHAINDIRGLNEDDFENLIHIEETVEQIREKSSENLENIISHKNISHKKKTGE